MRALLKFVAGPAWQPRGQLFDSSSLEHGAAPNYRGTLVLILTGHRLDKGLLNANRGRRDAELACSRQPALCGTVAFAIMKRIVADVEVGYSKACERPQPESILNTARSTGS